MRGLVRVAGVILGLAIISYGCWFISFGEIHSGITDHLVFHILLELSGITDHLVFSILLALFLLFIVSLQIVPDRIYHCVAVQIMGLILGGVLVIIGIKGAVWGVVLWLLSGMDSIDTSGIGLVVGIVGGLALASAVVLFARVHFARKASDKENKTIDSVPYCV